MRALVCLLAITLGCYRGTPPAPPPVPVKPTPRPRPHASTDVLAYLPDSSSLVVVLGLEQAMRTQSIQTLLPMLKNRIPANVAHYFDGCGFDPLALRRFSLGLYALDAPKPSGVMVVRGYRRDVLMKCIEQVRAAAPSSLSITDDVVVVPSTGSTVAMTFVDDTTLVVQIGPDTTVGSLRAAIEGGAPLRSSPRLAEHMAKLDPADPIWFVFDDTKLIASVASTTPVRVVTGSARLADNLSAQLRIRFPDPNSASMMATTFQTQAANAAYLFDQLTAMAEDNDLVIRAEMSDAKLTSLLSLLSGSLIP